VVELPGILLSNLPRRLTVFDQPGIGVEDLAWIHRDQFVHYVQMAEALGDPGDWSRFRHDVLRALTAAFGLEGATDGESPSRQHRVLQVLDEIRRRYDPVVEWPMFFEALWTRRHDIRADLPVTEGPCHIRTLPRATPSRHTRIPRELR
jgi:hypothetical protein